MLLKTEQSQQPSGIAVVTQLKTNSKVKSKKALQFKGHSIACTLNSPEEDLNHFNKKQRSLELLGYIHSEDTGLFVTVNKKPVGSKIQFHDLDTSQENYRDVLCHIGSELVIISVSIKLKKDSRRQLGTHFWQVAIDGISTFEDAT